MKRIFDVFSVLAQRSSLHMENIKLVNEDHVLCSGRRSLRLSKRFQDMILIVMYNDLSGFIRIFPALYKVLEYADCVLFILMKLTWHVKLGWYVFEHFDAF